MGSLECVGKRARLQVEATPVGAPLHDLQRALLLSALFAPGGRGLPPGVAASTSVDPQPVRRGLLRLLRLHPLWRALGRAVRTDLLLGDPNIASLSSGVSVVSVRDRAGAICP